jgi:hypothetical protein
MTRKKSTRRHIDQMRNTKRREYFEVIFTAIRFALWVLTLLVDDI